MKAFQPSIEAGDPDGARASTARVRRRGRPDPAKPGGLARHSRLVARIGLTIILLQFAVATLSMDVLAALRAYAIGESLYSKGQKDALIHLQWYEHTQREEEYTLFLQSLQVPEGDRRARLALQQFPPDLAAAREGLLAGQNAPDDIGRMIRLFLIAESLPLMKQAIRLWTDADQNVAELKQVAQTMHTGMQSAATRAQAMRTLGDYLPVANERVGFLTRAFLEELRRIGGTVRSALLLLNLGVVAALTIGGRRYLRRSWRTLQQREAETASLMDAVASGVLTVDADYRITHLNPAAVHLFGLGDSSRGALALSTLIREDLRADIDDLLASGTGRLQREASGLRSDGSRVDLEVTLSALSTAQGLNVALICRDISEQRAERERERDRHAQLTRDLQRKASTDALTGLPNRVALEHCLQGAVAGAAAGRQALSVLFIDLDGFKPVNDNYGHLAGDELLRQVAARLRDSMRSGDSVFRVGGDEFVVLTETGAKVAAEGLVGRLLNVMRQPYQLGEVAASVSASIGVAGFPEAGTDAPSLLQAADAAMYRAKQEGKGGCLSAAGPGLAPPPQRPELVRELERAIAHDELLLHYQPVVRAGDLAIVGAEALLRWRHPSRGLLAPASFVPLAEAHGLGPALGDWVLRQAIRRLAERPPAMPCRVHVNLAASQLLDGSLPRRIDQLLREARVGAHRLGVELTEPIALQAAEICRQLLTELHDLGVHVCMDDFGIGNSSLAQLHRMPVDMIKIDRSIVQNLPHNASALRLVEAIVAMSRALQVDVTAEGIETATQAKTLRQLGITELQGFGIGRPIAWESFCALPATLSVATIPALAPSDWT